MEKKTIYIGAITLVLMAVFIFVSYTLTKNQVVEITSIIDGDTIKVKLPNDKIEVVRLEGINAPEKGMPYYQDAINYLSSFKGKEVLLDNRGKDRYNRILAYILFNNKPINEDLLEEGFAHLYIFERDRYTEILEKAETEARIKNKGLWEKSLKKQDKCLDIVKEKKVVRINNICEFSVSLENYTLKDEGRTVIVLDKKIPKKSDILVNIASFPYPNSIFLRNKDGNLVSFYR